HGLIIHNDRAGLDQQASPTRHGVARVHRKIDDDLFDHAPIAKNRGRILRAINFQLNMFAQKLAKHRTQAADDFSKLDVAKLQELLAAEHEQLTNKICSAL